MRNKYPGVCYRCKKTVQPRDGHFERYQGGWRVQHASCCVEYKEKKIAERQHQSVAEMMIENQLDMAMGNGGDDWLTDMES